MMVLGNYVFRNSVKISLVGVSALCLMAGEGVGEAADDATAQETAQEAAGEPDGSGESASVEAQSGADAEPEAEVKVSGAVRFTYRILSWESEEGNRERLGDMIFDTFQIGADGSYGRFSVSGQYRFYQGYEMLHHGYLGYALSDNAQIDVGLTQAPFGVLPFTSHNWFFNLSYYMGMEDDYDLGVRGTFKLGDLDVRAAFYKSSEGTFSGASKDSARYGYDVVAASADELSYAGAGTDILNQEANQANLRVAYNLDHGDLGRSELGVSGRVGGLYNSTTERYGYHWAAAAHLNGTYGPLNLHLEGIAYRFAPSNPDGQSEDMVVLGAYDGPYFVAAGGYLLIGNLSYKLPVESDFFSSLSLHENYSILIKDAPDGADYANTQQNALGLLMASGPIYMYVDMVSGKHHPWLGPGAGYGRAMVEGRHLTVADGQPAGIPGADTETDDSWHHRFNWNIGYYF